MGFPSLCNVRGNKAGPARLWPSSPACHGPCSSCRSLDSPGNLVSLYSLTLNHSHKLHDAHAAPNWWWNWPWMQDATILFFFSIPESKLPTQANDRDIRMSAKSFSRTPWLCTYLTGLSLKFDGHKYTAHIHDLHKYWWSMGFCGNADRRSPTILCLCVFSLNGFMTDRCHTSLRLDR